MSALLSRSFPGSILLLTACLALLHLTACDGTDPARCVPGRVESCPCVGGTQGVQECLAGGTFGPCDCDQDPQDGGVDGDVEDDALLDGGPDGDAEADGETPLGRCTDSEDCELPSACVGGACVAPVPDPEDYVTAAAARCASWVWTIQLPNFLPERETCCFDYDDNGTPNDAYGSILAAMGSMRGENFDPTALLTTSIESFSQMLILDWVELPEAGDGEVRLSVFTGAPEADGGVGSADPAQWKLGQGTAFLHPDSFGDHGALWQINDATVVDHVVQGRGGPLLLWLPGLFTGPGLRPTILHQVRIRIPLPSDPPGCRGAFSEDLLVTPEGEEPFTAGGMTLGGLILFEDMMNDLDGALRTCTCAGVDPGQPALEWFLGPSGFEADCNPTNLPDDGSACTDLDDPICATAQSTCNYIGIMTDILDVDLDGDGFEDALSVGLRLGFSAVTIGGLVR